MPATAEDVTGIYRTIHQGLLQLRGNGDLNLVIPEATSAPPPARFTLAGRRRHRPHRQLRRPGGHLHLEVVAGAASCSKSTLVFETVDDPCAERQKYLTIDPWVYADS